MFERESQSEERGLNPRKTGKPAANAFDDSNR